MMFIDIVQLIPHCAFLSSTEVLFIQGSIDVLFLKYGEVERPRDLFLLVMISLLWILDFVIFI